MNTFFVRAYKKKRRRRRRNTFETWTRKRENGFRKNTSKKSEIKEKQKNHCSLRLTSSLLFFTLLLPLYLVSFARVLDVHASTIRALAGNVHRRAFPS